MRFIRMTTINLVPFHSPPMNHNKTPKHPSDYWLWDFLGTIFAGICIGAAVFLSLFL